ncbi:hypothetical protein FJT64_012409 [Amphibalanus amphitrite]|uniref:Peptidase S1 domain-containing protein n=1 Tax=Amphibalanus amphitrite TaxID=1232801 RepID=A0A6A4V6N0_AMPAM|nr:hypothetical protein FJT64_012409 [Amphibalanus amphitrite]
MEVLPGWACLPLLFLLLLHCQTLLSCQPSPFGAVGPGGVSGTVLPVTPNTDTMPPRGTRTPTQASQTTSTTSEKPELVELTYQRRRIPGTARNSTCCGIVDHRSNGTGTVNGTIEEHHHHPWMWGQIILGKRETFRTSETELRLNVLRGDSGSPLTVADQHEPSRRILLGLAIWTVRPCHTPSPDVFVKIPKYLDWIITNTENANYC